VLRHLKKELNDEEGVDHIRVGVGHVDHEGVEISGELAGAIA
jgi:hypothetical protein